VLRALLPAVVATAAFVLVRNSQDLEEGRFVVALISFSVLASVLAGAGAAGAGASRGRALLMGAVGLGLVPLLYVGFLAAYVVSVCLVGGQTYYS
jgi:hypothetical protein